MNKNGLGIFEYKNKFVVVESRIIAEIFHKKHKNVIRDIEELHKNIAGLKFEPSSKIICFIKSKYITKDKREQPCYLVTPEGFQLLTMSYTGQDALIWKLKYIDMFKQMEMLLQERHTTEWLQCRNKGKLIRRNETDMLQQLILYAHEQDKDANTKFVYSNYTKLVNKTVGIQTGERNTCSFETLSRIMIVEDIIQNTIKISLAQRMYWKEIYLVCREKCEMFAQMLDLKICPKPNDVKLLELSEATA